MARECLAHDAKAAHIELRCRIGWINGSQGQPAVVAEPSREVSAGCIDIPVVDSAEVVGGPVIGPPRQLAMPRFEEWPGEEGLVGHQSPSNAGFCFATKAS
jgi:hypothetical protein